MHTAEQIEATNPETTDSKNFVKNNNQAWLIPKNYSSISGNLP